MRFSLNLVTRSIVLTAVLLVGQLIFILALSDVLRVAQANIESQWRSENLIRLTFSMCRSFTELILYSNLPPDMRDFIGVDGPASLIRIKQDSESMRSLAATDPLKRDAIVRLLAADTVLIHMLEKGIEMRTIGAIEPITHKQARRYLNAANDNAKIFLDSVEQVVAIEKKRHDTEHSTRQTFAALTSTLVIAVLASIAVALILGFAYALSIRRPLKHLSANARLLSAQKELQPQLAQKDEFGRLDNILHATAREVEKTLKQEREAIENAADLICVLDEGGNFKSANPFAKKMLGRSPDDFEGWNLHDLTVAEDSLLADEHVRAAVQSSEVRQFELKLMHANGTVMDTRWSCLWSQAERKIFCVVRDVSEEKKIEQLKQDFADMISHDLRSPLMSMGNALTLLLAGVKGSIPEEALKRIDTSARNVEKLIVLVNDLLDFQKLKAGKMELVLEPVELESIIKDATGLVEEAALEKNIEIKLPVTETLVCGDRNKLMQVAVNLISNAIKFSGEGGAVVVTVEKGSQQVSFTVTDTGPGISPEFLQSIFEPFEQAPSDKKREGTGLGLAICKLVVEAHGGSISAKNRKDEKSSSNLGSDTGSIFTVVLPLDQSS